MGRPKGSKNTNRDPHGEDFEDTNGLDVEATDEDWEDEDEDLMEEPSFKEASEASKKKPDGAPGRRHPSKLSDFEKRQNALLGGEEEPEVTNEKPSNAAKNPVSYVSAVEKDKAELKQKSYSQTIRQADQDHAARTPVPGDRIVWWFPERDNQDRKILMPRPAIVAHVKKDDVSRRVSAINLSFLSPRGEWVPRHDVHYTSEPAEGKWSFFDDVHN